jgi:hypothetical protein
MIRDINGYLCFILEAMVDFNYDANYIIFKEWTKADGITTMKFCVSGQALMQAANNFGDGINELPAELQRYKNPTFVQRFWNRIKLS